MTGQQHSDTTAPCSIPPLSERDVSGIVSHRDQDNRDPHTVVTEEDTTSRSTRPRFDGPLCFMSRFDPLRIQFRTFQKGFDRPSTLRHRPIPCSIRTCRAPEVFTTEHGVSTESATDSVLSSKNLWSKHFATSGPQKQTSTAPDPQTNVGSGIQGYHDPCPDPCSRSPGARRSKRTRPRPQRPPVPSPRRPPRP